MRRQMRLDVPAVVLDVQSAETEHRCLPQPARRRAVDAVPSVAANVLNIGTSGAHEVLISIFLVAHAGRQDGLDGRTQRRAKGQVGAGGVIVVICLDGLGGEQFGQQVHQHHHIRLLQHLDGVGAFDSQNGLDGFGAGVKIAGEDIGAFEVPGELLDESATVLLRAEDLVCHGRPVGKGLFVDRQARKQVAGCLSVVSFEPLGNRHSSVHVPAHQVVGVGVVIDMLVVFVRTDHIAEVILLCLRVPLQA